MSARDMLDDPSMRPASWLDRAVGAWRARDVAAANELLDEGWCDVGTGMALCGIGAGAERWWREVEDEWAARADRAVPDGCGRVAPHGDALIGARR